MDSSDSSLSINGNRFHSAVIVRLKIKQIFNKTITKKILK